MPISGTTTSYTGRLVDMYISGPLNPLSSAPQPITYQFGTPTQYVAGIQKLAQRYLISLVNSGFINQLIGSSNSNISVATNLFNTYSWGVIQTFRNYQASNPSNNTDELMNTVQLTSVASAGDSISFTAQLISLAGNTVAFTLPLPI